MFRPSQRNKAGGEFICVFVGLSGPFVEGAANMTGV
jgi:hypothetical protein